MSGARKPELVPGAHCIDCSPGSTRPAYRPGPRCVTHARARKRELSARNHGKRVEAVYGITEAEYWAIYDLQDGVCFICQRARGTTKRLSVDHNHKTGEVRGLLCTPCNKHLGHIRDSIEVADRISDYLFDPPARYVLGPRDWKP